MKKMKSGIALTIILAVCSLAGCGKADSVHKIENGENINSADSALTTVMPTADKTENIQLTQTEIATSDQTEDIQPIQTETALTDQPENSQLYETEATAVGQSDSKPDVLTEQQALDAIRNYCFNQNPNLKNMMDSGEYNIYWDVTTNDTNEIIVLYRSYTAAQIRYYIDPVSGETYVTELVPGIIDEEQRTEESFNVRNYLS